MQNLKRESSSSLGVGESCDLLVGITVSFDASAKLDMVNADHPNRDRHVCSIARDSYEQKV